VILPLLLGTYAAGERRGLLRRSKGGSGPLESGGEAGGGKPEYSIIVPTYNERLNVYLIFKHLP
jgi:hypothetical protein